MGFKIFINFKTYPQGTGEKAVELAKIIQEVQGGLEGPGELEIIPVIQVVDVYRIKKEVDIPVWVQHVDWQPQGLYTGWTNLEAVVEAGASGTLLNHSEHPIPPGMIKQVLVRVKPACKRLSAAMAGRDRAGEGAKFESMICCKTLGQMERLVKLKPDFIGYEIGELIGGKVSITEANPKAVKHAGKICGKIPLVVGAGINTPQDLKVARGLGTTGVLISSAIVLADDPKKKIEELIAGL